MATFQAAVPDNPPDPLDAAEDPALINFSVRLPGIGILLASGLILRLGLAFLPGFGVDIGTFQAWAGQLATNDPWNFYNTTGFTDYAPGYMYVLWLIGEANEAFHFTPDQYEYIIKIPAIIADIASAWLLYRILENEKPGIRLGAVALYVFFPASLLIGAIWGQVDSILAFFLLLSVYYIGKDKPVHGAVAYTIGFLVKPQAIAALPFLAFWILRDHYRDLKTVLACTIVPFLVLLVLITPFFELQPWRLVEVLYDATNVENYRVNSFWAYNFWNFGGLFDQGFRCDLQSGCPDADATEWFGIATRYWGTALFASGIVAVVVSLRNARGMGYLALGTALSVLVFYLFLTRMHERYVFAAFLPLLLATVLINSRLLWTAFIALSVVHLANLYHVYGYYYPNELRVEGIYDWLETGDFFGKIPVIGDGLSSITGQLEAVQVFSFVMVASFLASMTWIILRLNLGSSASGADSSSGSPG
jgi:dolichyl-phosphate-mannose-protein mannosyltransferase